MEVDRPRRLVFTWVGPLTNHVNTLVTVELNPRGDETDLVLTHERLPTSVICEGHTRGWGNILDHLAEAVSKDFQVEISHSKPFLRQVPRGAGRPPKAETGH